MLLIRKGKKNVLINDFNRFMYNHSLYRGRKIFCRYCLHAFITGEILKRHIKNYFKINGKKPLKYLRKVNMIHHS